jgi:hypothetical protein
LLTLAWLELDILFQKNQPLHYFGKVNKHSLTPFTEKVLPKLWAHIPLDAATKQSKILTG